MSGAPPYANDMVSFALPIADIGELPASQYVGLIDPDAVTCLSARLAAEGLLMPIWVRRNGNAAEKRWSVIAGRHRLLAAAQLGWTEITVEQRADANSKPDELRRLQVAENLDHRVLRPIERALHLMVRWQDAASDVAPSYVHSQQSEAARARWQRGSNAPAGDLSAIDEACAESCGVTGRSVRMYRRLHKCLIGDLPDLFARLNAHPLGGSLSAMTELARVPEHARRTGAEVLLSRLDWPNVRTALEAAGFRVGNGGSKDEQLADAKFISTWRGMPAVRRRTTFFEMVRAVPASWLQEAVETTPGKVVMSR